MKVIKREEIVLSQKENEAFDLVGTICNGLLKEVTNPEIIRICEQILECQYDLFDYVIE